MTAVAALLLGTPAAQAEGIPKPDRYPKPDLHKERVELFVAQDKEAPAAPGGIIFAGSSAITRWNADLPKDFEDFDIIVRGFGGSTIADHAHFADKTILPHLPRQVVFYAGEQDIVSGRSPEGVLEDFERFATLVREGSPQTQILYIGITPGPRRKALQEAASQTNVLLKAYCESQDNLTYIDAAALLDKDGQPRPELYEESGLHLNKEGYAALASLLKPLLLPPLPDAPTAAPATETVEATPPPAATGAATSTAAAAPTAEPTAATPAPAKPAEAPAKAETPSEPKPAGSTK